MAPPRSFTRFKVRVLEGARAAPYPGFVEPCLATLRRKVPTGERWVHELAYKGLRVQAHLAAGRVSLYAERGFDCTQRFAPIAGTLAQLPANHAIIDGAIIGAATGRTAPPAAGEAAGRMTYGAFDLLYLDGFDIREARLVDRKRMLAAWLAEAGLPCVLAREHVDDGQALLRQARALRLAGIVSKLRDAPYRPGRSGSWALVECAPPHG